jgi:predicted ribosome quality control (RQC) complex YloA/Tae2 family protein
MYLDALALSAVRDELREDLAGARIQDVIQPTPHAVALQCWGGGQNRWLLASAHPQLARVHLVPRKPGKLVTEPPAFVMLLRKHLEGARVVDVRQPRWERVLELGFAHGPGAGTPPVWLVVEMIGRLSNLILRGEDGVILGALRQVDAHVNRYRSIAPHVPYRYPPPQTRVLDGETVPRLDGATVTADELREAAQETLATGQTGRGRKGQAPALADLLSAQLRGFSRDMGSEVTARALGTPEVPLATTLPWEEIAAATRALAALPETHAWRPTLVYANGSDSPPSAYAVYTPRHYPGAALVAAESVNALLATYYEGAEWRGALDGAKGDLRRLLQTQRDRSARKDWTLREELAALAEAAQLRTEADLLLAFQTEVPAGASSVTLENPFGGSEASDRMTVALDPRLSAVENATRRYTRYQKLQRAAAAIPRQIEANQLELARIEQLRTDLALADTPGEIALVRAEVAEAGYLRGNAARAERARGHGQGKTGKQGKRGKGGQPAKRGNEGGTPLRRQNAEGFVLLVGKNSRQNEEVTFHEASGGDLWLHARGVPGAHVIVKAGGRQVPASTLREAASLAAYYSQAREAGSVPVDYTQVRYVRHMKGGGPGMVTYEREQTLHVAPAEAAIER